jgi:hypothetical protein
MIQKLLLSLFSVFLALTNIQAEQFCGNGDGSIDNPFLICDTASLAKLARDVNQGISYKGKYFKLTSDLDLKDWSEGDSNNGWIPIGKDKENSFQGHFDGDNKSIVNLRIGTGGEKYEFSGLFGYIYATNNDSASIKNLKLINGVINNSGHPSFTGGLVGVALSDKGSNIEILNCNSNSIIDVDLNY